MNHADMFRRFGTCCPFIAPRRLAILSILQSARPSTVADDRLLWEHFGKRARQATT